MSTDKPVTVLMKDLGEALAAYRLSRNLRQDDVAAQAGISRNVVVRLEKGDGGTVDSLVRVLKALGLEDRISGLVPDARVSPLDPRASGDVRQRARPAADDDDGDEPWSWGE